MDDAFETLELRVKKKACECQRKLLKHQEKIPKQYERAIRNQILTVWWPMKKHNQENNQRLFNKSVSLPPAFESHCFHGHV